MTYFLLIVIAELSFLIGIWLHQWVNKRWPSPALTERKVLIWGAIIIGTITAFATFFWFFMNAMLWWIGRSGSYEGLHEYYAWSLLIGFTWCGIGALLGSRIRHRTNGIISGAVVGGFMGATWFSFIGIGIFIEKLPFYPIMAVYTLGIVVLGGGLGLVLTLLARWVLGRIGVPIISILPLVIIQLAFYNLTTGYVISLVNRVSYAPENLQTIGTLAVYGFAALSVIIFSLACGLAYGMPLQSYLSTKQQGISLKRKTAEPVTPPLSS